MSDSQEEPVIYKERTSLVYIEDDFEILYIASLVYMFHPHYAWDGTQEG